MGGQASKKKLVSNRPPPKQPVISGPIPVRMVPKVPKPQRKMVPPDGGWGWMVVLGACLSLFFFPAVTVAFGVLFTGHLSELGAGATEFTIIANGLSTILSFTALLVPPLSELFGYRSITITGGLLSFLTLLLAAYCTSLVTFAVSYSVIGGISFALSYYTGYIIIPHYFSRRKGLANGLVMSCAALGKIVMAPLVRLLLDEYGYVWACLLVGGLSLNTCVAGMLYHPPSWHMIPDPNEDKEMKVEGGGGSVVEGVGEVAGKQATNTIGPRPKTRRDDEEDEDIIFVMPTTPQQPRNTHDDELILFSRDANQKGPVVELSREERLKMIKMGSTSSLSGSLPVLAPSEYKVYYNDEDDTKESCFASCFLIKPFLMLDYTMLKEPNFHLISWPGAFLAAGYLNLLYALPGYATSLGLTHYQGALAISAFGGTQVVCRLAIAAVSDYSWFPVEIAYVSGYVLAALSAGCMTMVASYTWVLVWMMMFGVAISLTCSLSIHITLKYLGLDRYGQAVGFFSLNNGLNIAVIGFLVGLMRDYSGSYRVSFFFITAILILAAGVWVCRECVHYSTKYKKVPAHTP